MAPDTAPETPPSDTPPPTDPKSGGTFSSAQRRLEGKPVLIYGTLIGGAVALLLLLMVVWLSTRESGSQVKLCLDTNLTEAQSAIVDGNVRRIDVLLDAEQPVQGLTAIQLELENGECRKLPEGADNRATLLQVLGLVELYNQEGEGNIRVEYQRETVPPNLLMTSTPIPTVMPTTEAVSSPAGTPLPIVSPSPSPSPTTVPPTHTLIPTTTVPPTVTIIPPTGITAPSTNAPPLPTTTTSP